MFALLHFGIICSFIFDLFKKFSNLLGNINESYEDELEDEPSDLIDLLIAGDTSGNLHLRFLLIYAMKRKFL
jgi:hypothetical protein